MEMSGKILVVAEKPSAAKDFVAGLETYGKFKRIEQGYESDKYIVTNARGHLLALKEPKDYPNWVGKWNQQPLPWYPPDDVFDYIIPKSTADAYKSVKTVMKRNDISMIVNACDAGREGDLIFYEIYDSLKLKIPVKRFYESAVLTPKNVQHIMNNDLKGDDFTLPRRDAAYARAYADLLLGMNFTVGFTTKAGALLHMGRVQTPTIAILAKRREEIDNFVPEDYFEIETTFQNDHGSYKGMYFKGQLSNTKLKTKEEATAIVNQVEGQQGLVTKKDVKNVNEGHPLLYSLTTLQQHASRKYGYTATKTLELTQKLYETHKILSYPRSDSEVIGTDHVKSLPDRLQAISVTPYQQFVSEIQQKNYGPGKKMVDDKKLTDHHAIIPTEVKPNLASLTTEEKNIYDLVVKRFLAAFYPDAVYEKTEIVTEVATHTFKTSGRIEMDPGWKVVYGADVEEENDKKKGKEEQLPRIEKDEQNEVKEVKELAKKTQAPKHYTEADLLGIMKNPKKLIDDKELQDIMAEKDAGLGTPATRDSIIEKIVKQGYVERQKKNLVATDLGMKLVQVSPEGLKSPEITASWEKKLHDIEIKENTKNQFMTEIKQYIEENLLKLKEQGLTVTFSRNRTEDEETPYTCPKCKGKIVFRKLKTTSVYACSNHTKETPCIQVYEKTLGKKLTKSQIKQLFEKGKTSEIKGLKNQSGVSYDAPIGFNLETLRVIPIFEKKASSSVKSNVTCPLCGGTISENKLAFGCSNWKAKDCKFTVWKNGSTLLNINSIQKMIDSGETEVISDFLERDKKTKYKAVYVFNKNDKKIESVRK